ncbi:polysaccharide biosynthesis/export family protein [Armatimonas sp.]|uniref:polysaccharide biosynthesis/export family protein n=1 Tax=Armatimonas sp. TaxID=1872638 RepID=UPI00286B3EB7|nr:polysaccharide biosynthesis/export family protein [Armatimonas sp.]
MKIDRTHTSAWFCLLGLGISLVLTNVGKCAEPLKQEKITETYRVEIDDVLAITVLNHPEFSLAAQVLPDGTITFPILGKLTVVGRTREQISNEIATGLKNKKQLVKPYVTINVTQRAQREITILGAVRGAGKLPLKDNWTVLDALGAAGGVGSGTGPTTDRYEFYSAQLFRETQVIALDLAKVYANDPVQNIALKNGDKIYIVVKPRDQITVTVIGEVANGRGGTIELPKDKSILTILNDLGGVTEAAALSKATLLRNGTIMKLDLRGFKKGKIENTISLAGGDVLTIPRLEDRYKINGVVSRPGELYYPDDRKLTLFDVLTQAGIPPTGAELKKVSLTRFEKGVATTQKHDIDKMLKGDRSQDVEIQPGDEIFVPASDPNKRKLGIQDYVGILGGIVGLLFFFRR